MEPQPLYEPEYAALSTPLPVELSALIPGDWRESEGADLRVWLLSSQTARLQRSLSVSWQKTDDGADDDDDCDG